PRRDVRPRAGRVRAVGRPAARPARPAGDRRHRVRVRLLRPEPEPAATRLLRSGHRPRHLRFGGRRPGDALTTREPAYPTGGLPLPTEIALPTYADIEDAARRIDGIAHRTPVLTSRYANETFGAELYFKAEHLQRMGAFKFRGALN